MTDHENKEMHKSRSWLERLTSLLLREPHDREELMKILRDAEERNVISNEIVGMMERILQVAEMQVREVMIPKVQMVILQNNATLAELLPIVIESGHSRFPIMDSNSEDIIGILLAKDLIKYCFKDEAESFKIADIMRPAFFTTQSKRLDILLKEFRINRNHLAIVIDEYGHVAGLVTIEDVLEQIVGEIEDEYDIQEEGSFIKKLEDDCYIIKASTLIEDFNQYFKTNFSDAEFDTIGGIVLKNLGHLPQRGETVKISPFRFKVLHSDNRRLYLLEMKPLKKKK